MTKLTKTLALVLISTSSFAQLIWQKGGNNSTPAGQPATIGTDATWNSPLGFLTNGVQDLNPYAVFSCYCNPPKSSTLAH